MKILLGLAVAALGICPLFAGQTVEEQAVWKLEHSYWDYVKASDLNSYRHLWHADFVGWPSSSARPARKDHITDWITKLTDKGLRLDSYKLEPTDSQATENIVVTHYWITDHWVDKSGVGEPDYARITHTWIRTPGGWQIIGGMSCPEKEKK